MDRRYRFSSILAALSLAVAACDGSGTTSGSGTSSSTSASSGTGGTTNTPSAWKAGDPGKPGTLKRLGGGIAFAQGLSQMVVPTDAVTFKAGHCFGDLGSGGAGGGGGAGGAPMGGGEAVNSCPSTYTPASPTLDLSAITETDLTIAIAAQPVLQPVVGDWGQCASEMQPIGGMPAFYKGDCTGVVTSVPVFNTGDLNTFFGLNNPLPANTVLEMNGGIVTLITGSAVKTALIGSDLFAASNVSSTLIKVDGSNARTDLDLGTKGISALVATPSGTLVFATHRTFTMNSWNGAMGDPANLIEADPISLKSFDPATSMVTDLATIHGGSRVIAQNSTDAGTTDVDGNPTRFIAGSMNVLALAQNGNLLFADRLTGKVYEITPDGLTVTELFQVPEGVMVSGLTQPPNGITYVVKSATANANCDTILSYPTLTYWDAGTTSLVDWQVLSDPEYDTVLPALCKTGVIEKSKAMGQTSLGAGDFVDVIHDTQGNLIVSDAVTGITTAYSVVVSP